MKTKVESNRKSKRENVTLKSVIIAATLLIAGVAASAQGGWETYFETEKTAYLHEETSVESAKTLNSKTAMLAAFATYLKEETEEAIEVEAWMTDAASFGTFITVEEVTEAPLELEEWMLSEKTFNVKTEEEEPLKIENWMTAENVWK